MSTSMNGMARAEGAKDAANDAAKDATRAAGRQEARSGGRPALPPAAELAAMLRESTERLARELAQPSDEPPAWHEAGWRVAMAAATIHGVAGLLADRLRWEGPPLWQAFLADQRHQMRQREQRIRDTLQRIDLEARRDGLPVVGLKGSALLSMNLYAPGRRPMADIDLLVRPEDRLTALRMLARLGYRPGVDSGRHLTLLPASSAPHAPVHLGEHADHAVKLELHTRVAEPLPAREVDITARILPASARPGLRPYPGRAALMRHLLLHAAGNMRTRSLRLIQLHDLALMADRLTESDWTSLAAGEGGHAPAWWALPPLRMALRHFPSCGIDEHRLRAFEPGCPPWLRRHAREASLTDLSTSRLFCPWLPGLVWARDPVEALRLVRARLWPSRAAKEQSRAARGAEAWIRDNPTASLPRWARVRRWRIDGLPAARFSVEQAMAYEWR